MGSVIGKQPFLDLGMLIHAKIMLAKAPSTINQLFISDYKLEMALGDSKKKYPDIWLGYDSDHLIVGLQSGDWDLVKILVHVRPADAYLKSLEGYSYQLLSQHDDQGFLGLTLKPIGIKTQETGVSLPRSYHKDMSKGAGVQCAWFIHKSHLKGWSPKDHSSFELAVCWSVSSQKKSLGWPIETASKLESSRHYWAECIFQR